MRRRHALTLAWVGFLLLLALHLDFWRPQRSELLFGWLPVELAYRVLFLVLAWLYMVFICSRVWIKGAD